MQQETRDPDSCKMNAQRIPIGTSDWNESEKYFLCIASAATYKTGTKFFNEFSTFVWLMTDNFIFENI